ncbi:MAG: hypothetical protein ABJG78_14460 [Cyclobacteriaceae bacterium]
MSSFGIRPRFKHSQRGERSQIEAKIRNALDNEKQFIATQLSGHLHIKVHPDEQHFWSPQLDLSFEQEEEEVIIRGMYGPKPTLWAVFFFGYVVLGILTIFVGMWGLTRWSLGMSSMVLWAIPVFAALAAIMYFMAQTGQKLGAQEMFDIHHFYEETIGEKIHI